MSLDPLTISNSYNLVKEIAHDIQKTIKYIKTELKSALIIENESVKINCGANIQKYSASLRKKDGLIFNKNLEFHNGKPNSVDLTALVGATINSEAVILLDDGFIIKTEMLVSGNFYYLEVEYLIKDPRFIDQLVDRSSSRDIPSDGDEILTYEMSAQLKHPGPLHECFSSIQLKDLELTVQVGVQEDVDTKVPNEIKQEIEKLIEIATKVKGRETLVDIVDLQRMSLELQKIHSSSKYAGTTFDVLKKISDVFMPNNFVKYLDIGGDFQYAECKQGIPFYKVLPMQSWPQSMNIISKTDLSLEKCASNGTMKYNKGQFLNTLSDIF